MSIYGNYDNLNIINEACNLYSTNSYYASLDYEPKGEAFWKDPYIKVYDVPSYTNSKNCIRVHLKDGRCEHHRGDKKGGLPFSDTGWKKFLNSIMNLPCNKYPNMIVHDAIYFEIKMMYSLTDEQQAPYIFPSIDFVTQSYWGGKNVKQKR